MSKKISVSVIGDGGWGTTLAILLQAKGFPVTLWGAFNDYVAYLSKKRVNTKFLPGVRIPREIEITDDLRSALEGKQLIILAIPAQYLRQVLGKIKHLDYPCQAIYVNVSKGIEIGSLKRMSEVIYQQLGRVKLAILSGPTIAHEVACGIPTAAVIASREEKISKQLQDIFMTERFRIYTNRDVIGVELGGSLKNVIAIACGICDGLGFGTNAKAAILSRGITEISRLGSAMGAKADTFNGLSGLGDLVTTCISHYSRNRYVGEQVGKGKPLRKITDSMQMVAEGIATAKSAYGLSLKYKVDMPITREVYNVLYKNKPALRAVRDLMTRKKKKE